MNTEPRQVGEKVERLDRGDPSSTPAVGIAERTTEGAEQVVSVVSRVRLAVSRPHDEAETTHHTHHLLGARG